MRATKLIICNTTCLPGSLESEHDLIPSPDLGEEHKGHYHGGHQPESHGEYSSQHVGPLLQDSKGNDGNDERQGGGIDDGSYVLGVVQAFHFHFPSAKGKEDGGDLHEAFVAEQEESPGHVGHGGIGATGVDELESGDSEQLWCGS